LFKIDKNKTNIYKRKMIKDIGNFNNTNDYLPILNAVIITDMIWIILSNTNIIKSKSLKNWYNTFNLSAVIADVLIIVLGLILTRYLYYKIFKEFSIINFIILALSLQITHDILFYIMITLIPKGSNRMIDVFKEYANEVSYLAIIGDSLMMIIASLLAYNFVNLDFNTNIIILIIVIYLIPYMIYK
jgi:hypothetical protein